MATQSPKDPEPEPRKATQADPKAPLAKPEKPPEPIRFSDFASI